MQEVEQVRYGRSETLYLLGVQLPDGGEDLDLGVAADACIEQAAEGALVVGVLVDVRDAQLGFPQECVVGTFEDLALLGDGMNHRLQRGATVGVAEGARLDVGDDLLDAAADGAEILHPLLPQEPGAVGRAGVLPPPLDQCANCVRQDQLSQRKTTPGKGISFDCPDAISEQRPAWSTQPSRLETDRPPSATFGLCVPMSGVGWGTHWHRLSVHMRDFGRR